MHLNCGFQLMVQNSKVGRGKYCILILKILKTVFALVHKHEDPFEITVLLYLKNYLFFMVVFFLFFCFWKYQNVCTILDFLCPFTSSTLKHKAYFYPHLRSTHGLLSLITFTGYSILWFSHVCLFYKVQSKLT